jgi:hypothetical protein
MMKRIALALALLAVSLLLLNVGCYTVLRHPTGSSVVQEGSHYRTCADCHADAGYYHPYGRSYGHPYYRSHNRWGSYYGSPWWYDDYWWWDDHDYDHDHDDDYEGPEVETGTRHLWSSGGWPTRGWGPGTGSTRAPASEPTQKNDKKKIEVKEKMEEKEKPKETEEEKEKRSPWNKPTGRRG